jgi:quercetin dioxygenase-like cupin family protein
MEELARDLAGEEDLWRPFVQHDPARRTYHRLLDTDEATVWLICWMRGQDTGFHDHDGSSGAVVVLEGRLVEELLVVGAVPRARRVETGQAFAFGPQDIHRVRHAGGPPAVSLHAYSPRLRGMGTYSLGPGGVLRRELIGPKEQLVGAGREVAAT